MHALQNGKGKIRERVEKSSDRTGQELGLGGGLTAEPTQ